MRRSRGVSRHAPVTRKAGDCRVDVGGNVHVDNTVDAVTIGRRPYFHSNITGMPVDDEIGSGCAGNVCLFVAAHRCRHPRPCPLCKKNGGVTDRTGATVHENPLTSQVCIGKQASMRRHRGDAERRTDPEGHVVGQPDCLPRRHHDEFRSRPERPPRLGHVDPHPLAYTFLRHAGADTVDDARPVLMRNDSGKWHGLTAEADTRLDVRRIDARDHDPDPDFPARAGDREARQRSILLSQFLAVRRTQLA